MLDENVKKTEKEVQDLKKELGDRSIDLARARSEIDDLRSKFQKESNSLNRANSQIKDLMELKNNNLKTVEGKLEEQSEKY